MLGRWILSSPGHLDSKTEHEPGLEHNHHLAMRYPQPSHYTHKICFVSPSWYYVLTLTRKHREREPYISWVSLTMMSARSSDVSVIWQVGLSAGPGDEMDEIQRRQMRFRCLRGCDTKIGCLCSSPFLINVCFMLLYITKD